MQIFKKKISLIIISILLISLCSCYQGEPGIRYVDIREHSNVLILMYLSGDANNGDNFFPTMQQAEDALTYIRDKDLKSARIGYKSVNVLALWDGPEKASSNDKVHSDFQTRLLKLGPGSHNIANDGTDSGTYGSSKTDWSLSSNTKDLTSTVDWIIKGDTQEVNMGSVKTLTNFLTWVNRYFRGDEVILFFGDHGAGPGVEVEIENNKWYTSQNVDASGRAIMYDSDMNGEEGAPALRICDILTALQASGFTGENKPELIVEDLCYGGTIEEVQGLKGAAHYFMASPNYTSGNSMGAYHFITNLTESKSLKKVCQEEIDNFAKKWPNFEEDGGSSTFTLVDLSQQEAIENIKNNVSLLAQKLLSDDSYKPVISSIKNKKDNSGLVFNASYVYLKEMGWLLDTIEKDFPQFPELAEYTSAIKSDLSKVVISSFASARYYTGHEGQSFTCYNSGRKQKWEGNYATGNYYGLAISITQQTSILDTNKNVIKYEDCTTFGQDNKWGELLRTKN